MAQSLCIRNPKSSHLVVKVSPGQDFSVYFSTTKDVVDFDFESIYFKLDNCQDINEDGAVYTFKQSHPDLCYWGDWVSVFLGEIFILKEHGQSRISVILSSEKSDVLSIVDPSIVDLRLRPYQILEVILTEPPTNFTIMGGFPGIIYQKFSHMTVSPKSKLELVQLPPVKSILPVISRTNGEEYHYWFRALLPTQLPKGVYDAGTIRFGANHLINASFKLRKKDTKGIVMPRQTIVPHKRTVVIEELQGDFYDGCDTLEFVGQNRILRTKNNQVLVYKSSKSLKALPW